MMTLRMCSVTASAFNLLQSKSLLRFSTFIRSYATRKRFYKRTGILQSDGKFEITLDQRKVKTPNGNRFFVESEPLALAVANEWDAQKDDIVQASMHLTILCNTALDNPNKFTKFDCVNYLVNYLDTDTILFQSCDDKELFKFQVEEWDPIIEWFCQRFHVDVRKTVDIVGASIPDASKAAISRHLSSYSFAALNGFVYGVDTLKSVILTMACVDRVITPEKAVLLSRLEEEFQLGHWGRVEWAHDLNQQDLQSRLAATLLFIYFNSTSNRIQTKTQK